MLRACALSRRVKRLTTLLLTFLTCLQLCGGPQGLMQCVAWARMLADYSQDHSVAEAVEMTFDGEHPCPLCCAIMASQKQQQQDHPSPAPAPDGKLLKICKHLPLFTVAALPPVSSEESKLMLPGALVPGSGRPGEVPPVPPPRA